MEALERTIILSLNTVYREQDFYFTVFLSHLLSYLVPKLGCEHVFYRLVFKVFLFSRYNQTYLF